MSAGYIALRKELAKSGELFKKFSVVALPDGLGEAFRQFNDSPVSQLIRRLNSSEAFKVGSAIAQSPTFKTLEQIRRIFDSTTELNQAVKALTGSSLGSMSIRDLVLLSDQLAKSPLANFLEPDSESDFDGVVEQLGQADVVLHASGDGQVVSAEQLEMDQAIVEQIEKGNHQSLSPEQTWRLRYIILLLALVWKGLSDWGSVTDGVCDLNARFGPDAPFAEVRRQVRIHFCGESAAHVRIVKGDDVNVRAEPSMKSEVITQLHKGKVVAVVSREDRDWLEVSFKRDGFVIEGWVSRKYLQRVR